MNNIYCIMFSGIALSDFARSALFKTALRMHRERKRKCRIVHDDVEGEVYTKFETGLLGSIAGYVFEAEIGTPKGNSKVKYLVRESDMTDEDIDKGRWVEVIPVCVNRPNNPRG